MTDQNGLPPQAKIPELTEDEKARQRAALDLVTRMARGAALSVPSHLPISQSSFYYQLAPATRIGAEVHHALAWLLAYGLITVNEEAFERMFSIGYEIPEHLQDAEHLGRAFARGW